MIVTASPEALHRRDLMVTLAPQIDCPPTLQVPADESDRIRAAVLRVLMAACGTNAKWCDVRFMFAMGGEADIGRR